MWNFYWDFVFLFLFLKWQIKCSYYIQDAVLKYIQLRFFFLKKIIILQVPSQCWRYWSKEYTLRTALLKKWYEILFSTQKSTAGYGAELRKCGLFNSKWDTYIKSPRLRGHCGSGGGRSVKARGSDWLQGHKAFWTQQGNGTHSSCDSMSKTSISSRQTKLLAWKGEMGMKFPPSAEELLTTDSSTWKSQFPLRV